MRASRSFVWAAFVGLVALGVNACAPMGVGPPVVTDVPKHVEQRSMGTGATDDAVTQEGSRLIVRVTELCDVQRVTRVERTTVREHQNEAPQNDWWAGVGGVVLAGLGAVTVVEPRPLKGSDGHEYTKAEVRQGGYLLVGLGAALLAVPVIDAIRANSVADRRVEEVEVPGPFLRRNVACGGAQVGKEIALHFPEGQRVEIGQTGPKGRLVVDLSALTPAGVFFARDQSATVEASGRPIGRASLAALYDEREAAAWQLAEASLCRTSLDESACEPVGFYAAHYAGGEHATAARTLLDDAAARRLRAREEAAWGQLDLRACRAPKKQDRETIEAACAPLSAHLNEFPEGPHVDELRATLRPAEALTARLKAAEERRAEATAAIGSWGDADDEPTRVPSTGKFIPYAGNGRGPTLCADGMWSHSSGRGTCSHHGGVGGGGHSSHGSHRSFGGRSPSWGHQSSGGGHRGWGGGGHRSSGGRGRRK